MTKDLWINLPVKDVERSKEFFTRLGFVLNETYVSTDMACFNVGEKHLNVLFFAEETFKSFTKSEISDTNAGSEVLISFDAESREEVDAMAAKVQEAGGTIYGNPGEIQGWMYGFAFVDPDGHRWNQVFMDFSKLPQQ